MISHLCASVVNWWVATHKWVTELFRLSRCYCDCDVVMSTKVEAEAPRGHSGEPTFQLEDVLPVGSHLWLFGNQHCGIP